MDDKTIVNIVGWTIFIIAMMLLWIVDWKIAIGVLLFGTAMNIENHYMNNNLK